MKCFLFSSNLSDPGGHSYLLTRKILMLIPSIVRVLGKVKGYVIMKISYGIVNTSSQLVPDFVVDKRVIEPTSASFELVNLQEVTEKL